MLDLSQLIGLTPEEAAHRLTQKGVSFRFNFYQTDKQSLWDTQLVVSARKGNPIELVVGRFLFSCEVQYERDA